MTDDKLKCLPCAIHYGRELGEQILPLIVNLDHSRALLEYRPDDTLRDAKMDAAHDEFQDALAKTNCERVVNLIERSDAAEWAREFEESGSGVYEMYVDTLNRDIYMRRIIR